MKKVKAFFYIFRKSFIPNNSYYKKITKTPFFFSIKYFISLLIFLNFILFTSILNLYPYNTIQEALSNLIDNLKSFPKELVIIKKNNNLVTTLDRPYFFWLKIKNTQTPFLIINETADDNFSRKIPSTIFLTNQYLIVKSPLNQTITKIPLSSIIDFSIDKNIVNKIILPLEKLKQYFLLIYTLFFVLLFFMLIIISFSITSIYLLIASFVVYLYFKLRQKRHFHYKKILQISFHAITFILVIEYLFFLIPFPFKLTYQWLISLAPFLFILVSSLTTGVGVWLAYNNHSQ